MKRIYLLGILLVSFSQHGNCTQKLTEVIQFASVEKSQMLLSQEDDFTDRWSPLDIDIRMQKANSTKEELLAYIPTQALEWDDKDKRLLYSIIEKIDTEIFSQGYKLNIPDTIFFIKTTMDEEFKGASGYTRTNYIILNTDKIKVSNDMLEHVIIHELFHVLSRHDPEFRSKMYGLIGFKMINEIRLPNDLQVMKLTNPDAPYIDSYIQLEYDNQPVKCAMINYSKKSYREGTIKEYLNIGFLKLTDSEEYKIDYIDEKPMIYSIQEVSDFFEQVGKNTNYLISPEEILAENFTHILLNKKDLPNPEIIDKIKKILRE
ncbi:hypothetical protein [Xanthomarina sp. GH4-25]|uniref:hypothetical protein n=1 Tax=Xanthomarina sp. GH4-25 TaxID=3349335 RepID=UPI003877D82E